MLSYPTTTALRSLAAVVSVDRLYADAGFGDRPLIASLKALHAAEDAAGVPRGTTEDSLYCNDCNGTGQVRETREHCTHCEGTGMSEC